MLINREYISDIINCRNADIEGEVIGLLIIQNALEGKIKPIKRLWLSEQTDETIRQSLKNLKGEKDYFFVVLF